MKSRPNVTTTLGHLADLQAGFPFKSAGYSQSQSGTRLLRGDNIGPGFLRWDNPARWESTDVDSEYELRSGDIVLAMDRPWVSTGLKFARIGEPDLPAYLVQRVSRLRAREGVNQRYLQYVVASSEFSAYVLGVQTGTAVPHISGSQILSYRLAYRPRAEQRAIAEILGALDDKIASNDRVLKLSDNLVRARFAALDGAEVALGDIAVNVRDQLDPSVVDAETPYVGLEHVPRRLMWLGDPGLAEAVSSMKSTFLEGDVLFGKLRPYFHKVVRAPFAGIASTDILIVRAKNPAYAGIVLAAVASDKAVAAANSAADGTRMPRAKWQDLEPLPVAWPSDSGAAKFSREVEVIGQSTGRLAAESHVLAVTRDELLPLLMSGRLRVKDAERAVEEVL